MKKILISVIMSVKNGQPYLAEAIESILGQSLRDFEFIIIDDCSDDHTPKILRDFAHQDQRIKIITNQINLGLTKSLNLGIKKARGKYLARLDADDRALPDRLRSECDFLETHPDIFLVGGGMTVIDSAGLPLHKYIPVTDPKKIARLLPRKNILLHGTVMFRHDHHTLYREKFVYSQDYDLYLNLLTRGLRLANLLDIFLEYRLTPNSISIKKAGQQILFAHMAQKFYTQRLITKHDDYKNFTPDAITNLNSRTTTDTLALEAFARAYFITGDKIQARHFSKRCLKTKGSKGTCLRILLASYLPANILRLFGKTKLHK